MPGNRVFTSLKPVLFFIFGIGFAVLHDILNEALNGRAVADVDAMTSSTLDELASDLNINISGFDSMKQKYQHMVLTLLPLLVKTCITKTMLAGLAQQAWMVLRTEELSVGEIDAVVALQHQKTTGLWCLALWVLAPGSLTVVQVDNNAVYAYDRAWLIYPYIGNFILLFFTTILGLHRLWYYNTSNMNFNFSHIIVATRNHHFDKLLEVAEEDEHPAIALQEMGNLQYGTLRRTVAGKHIKGFGRVKDLLDTKSNRYHDRNADADDDPYQYAGPKGSDEESGY